MDNESLTTEPGRIERIKADAGGDQSEAWLRERMLIRIRSVEKTVIPEYDPDIHDVDNFEFPEHYDTYMSADFGLIDHTAGLFAHFDFKTRTLCVEDEFFAHMKSTREIVDGYEEDGKKFEGFRGIEKRLWGTLPCKCQIPDRAQGEKICAVHGRQPYMRVGDNELQQLFDMSKEHGYFVAPTKKDDLIASINDLRLRFSENRIRIHTRCTALRHQLQVGMWNEKGTDFVRGERRKDDRRGHLDALMALVYMNRNVNEHHNPWPKVRHPQNVFVAPENLTEDDKALLDAFGF